MKKIILLAMLLNILACDNTTESSQVDEHKQNLTFNNAIEKLKSNHKEEGYQILITLANNGDMKAENELGRIYQFSVLGEKNCDKSKYWYEKSSNSNYSVATHNLAYVYMSNECPYNEIKLAKRILESNKDFAPSENLLGVIYIKGWDGKVNIEKGIQYLEMASNKNNLDATNSLGLIYLKGLNGKKDFNKALLYFEKGISLGDSNSLFNLSSMYLIGNGVEKNEKYAFDLMEKSAQKNNPVAQFYLGEFYEKGEIVEMDKEKSNFWYRQSAEQGYAPALLRI